MTVIKINKIAGALLAILTITVSMPLTIKTFQTHGGPWGFGIIGITVLLPLNCYFLFALAAWLNKEETQRKLFIASHLVTMYVGLICYLLLPIYPKFVWIVPIVLALLGIFNKKHLKYYLLIMMAFAIVANVALLKWELDFHRTLPLFQLFQSMESVEP